MRRPIFTLRLLTIAAIGTGLALYDAATRWRDLHLAACRRIVELERLLRFERSQVDDLAEQVEREQKLAEGLGALARVALRNEVFLADELKHAKDRVRALNLEVAGLREIAAPGAPPIDEALLKAAQDVLALPYCGACGADRLAAPSLAGDALRSLQKAVERAVTVRAVEASDRRPLGEMAVDGTSVLSDLEARLEQEIERRDSLVAAVKELQTDHRHAWERLNKHAERIVNLENAAPTVREIDHG